MDQATWKTSFILSLCFHIILLFGATVLPDLIKTKPNFDDIYTVDLIDLAEPAVQEPMEPSGIEEPKIIEAQPVHKEALPPKDPDVHLQAKIAEIKAAIPPVTTEKPVSIKPLKRKLVKKNTSVAANSRRKDLEQIAKQRLKEAKRAEELAQKAAQLAADRAVSQLRNELLIREKTKAADSASHKRAGERTGLTRSVVESQYFANLFSHLHPNWKLPQHRLWDNELSATIVITIASDGRILKNFFEKRSGDRLFDQFVLKALQDSNPLPPLPKVLNKTTLEVGLHFTPGSIQ